METRLMQSFKYILKKEVSLDGRSKIVFLLPEPFVKYGRVRVFFKYKDNKSKAWELDEEGYRVLFIGDLPIEALKNLYLELQSILSVFKGKNSAKYI